MTCALARPVAAAVLVFVAAAAVAAQVPRVTVGGNAKEPTRVKHVSPVYPAAAKADKIGGTVVLEVVIATDGAILEVDVTKSVHILLDDAAVAAVRQWRYTPTEVDGEPVELVHTVSVSFIAPD